MTGQVWAMLLALSVLWGGSFFFVEIAVAAMPVLVLVWLRVALAAAALLVFLRLTGRAFPRDPAILLAFLGMGMLNNVIPFSLIAWGQTEISSGLASIINAMMPVSTVLLAHVLTEDENLTPAKALGVALGFLGVAVLIGWDALGGIGAAVLGQLAVLVATVSYGCAGIFGRRFRQMGVDPVTTAAGQVMASTLLLALPMLVIGQPWAMAMPGGGVWLSTVALALFSTAFAYVLFFRILAAGGAGIVSLVTLLVPVSAVILGAVFLGERLEARHLAGMALIGTGLLCLDGRLVRHIVRLRARHGA